MYGPDFMIMTQAVYSLHVPVPHDVILQQRNMRSNAILISSTCFGWNSLCGNILGELALAKASYGRNIFLLLRSQGSILATAAIIVDQY